MVIPVKSPTILPTSKHLFILTLKRKYNGIPTKKQHKQVLLFCLKLILLFGKMLYNKITFVKTFFTLKKVSF